MTQEAHPVGMAGTDEVAWFLIDGDDLSRGCRRTAIGA